MALKPQEFYNVVKNMQSSPDKSKSMEERIREKARRARQSGLLEQAKLDTFQQDSNDYETKLASLQKRYQSDAYVDPNEVKDLLAHGKALENRAAAYETYLKDYAPDQKDALSSASAIKKNFADQLTGLSGVQKFYGQFETP